MRYLTNYIIYCFLLIACIGCSSTQQYNAHTHPLKDSTDRYLLIKRDVLFSACTGNSCISGSGTAFGSGFIVGTDGKDSLGVTAGHVCVDFFVPPGVEVVGSSIKAKSFDGRVHNAIIIRVDKDKDLCLIKIQGLISKGLPVSFDAPKIGDPVYTMASPFALFEKNMVPLFSGFFSGQLGPEKDAYTIPTQGGSSGAPIVNANGEVIGIVIAKIRGLESFCVSPPYASVRDFILGAFHDLRLEKL